MYVFFFQAEDGIRDATVTGVQTCALPIYRGDAVEPRDRGRGRDPAARRRATSSAAGSRGSLSRGPRRGTDRQLLRALLEREHRADRERDDPREVSRVITLSICPVFPFEKSSQ